MRCRPVNRVALIGLFVGPALFCALLWAPVPAELLGPPQRALAVMALCMTWWLTTPVAMPVTSLLGMSLLPILGVLDKNEAVALFGNQSVFFVIAAFISAAVMIRTGLSTRITLFVLQRLSRSEDVLCGAVLAVAGGMTAVVVSHAVAALLLPIMVETLRALGLEPGSRFARRLLLSMAWGTIGGSNLSLLSSARASLATGMYEAYNTQHGLVHPPIGFFEYSSGTALVAVLSLVMAYFILRWYHPPDGLDLAPAVAKLHERAREMGDVSRAEWITAGGLVAMVVSLVVFGREYGLGTIALLFSAGLFVTQVIQWEDTERFVNWGVALLYGGAIAVAAAVQETGGIAFLVHAYLPIQSLDAWSIALACALLTVVITAFVSNAAAIALLLPLCLTLAAEVGLNARAMTLLLPIAAGLDFSLPMSTPAMAMVFGTGYLRPADSVIPGIVLSILGLGVLMLVAWGVWPLFGLPLVGG